MSASFLIFPHYRISQPKSKGIPEKNRLRCLDRDAAQGDSGRRSRYGSG